MYTLHKLEPKTANPNLLQNIVTLSKKKITATSQTFLSHLFVLGYTEVQNELNLLRFHKL